MSQHDIGSKIKLLAGINPIDTVAATINGPSIDRQGFLSAVLGLQVGAASGGPTAQPVDAALEDSADGTTFAAVSPAVNLPQLTADNTASEVDVDLVRLRQFIRVVVTVAFTGGAAPAIDVAAPIVLGGADVVPV